MAADLETPRIVYRGTAPEKGALPDPVETLCVEDDTALSAALAAGWRLHRHEDTPVKAIAAKPALVKAAAKAAG